MEEVEDGIEEEDEDSTSVGCEVNSSNLVKKCRQMSRQVMVYAVQVVTT